MKKALLVAALVIGSLGFSACPPTEQCVCTYVHYGGQWTTSTYPEMSAAECAAQSEGAEPYRSCRMETVESVVHPVAPAGETFDGQAIRGSDSVRVVP